MDTKYRMCVMIMLLCGILIQAVAADDNAAIFKPLMVCPPLDPANIVDTLPVPDAIYSPDFSNTLEGGFIRIPLRWSHVPSPDEIDRYYIQASDSPNFEVIQYCPLMPNSLDTVSIKTPNEGILWFRIRTIVVSPTEGLLYSYPSPVDSTILDITPPVITDLGFELIENKKGERPIVRVHYEATELFPAKLRLTEDISFSAYKEVDITEQYGDIDMEVSFDEERKYIYAIMVDKAGNESDIKAANGIIASTSHNYPNPFRPDEGTTIVFNNLSNYENSEIKIFIYDLFGNLVLEDTYPDCHVGVNDYYKWDGRNGRGDIVADGGYICIIKAGNDIVSRHKIAVAK